jgi:hypothetical protein
MLSLQDGPSAFSRSAAATLEHTLPLEIVDFRL